MWDLFKYLKNHHEAIKFGQFWWSSFDELRDRDHVIQKYGKGFHRNVFELINIRMPEYVNRSGSMPKYDQTTRYLICLPSSRNKIIVLVPRPNCWHKIISYDLRLVDNTWVTSWILFHRCDRLEKRSALSIRASEFIENLTQTTQQHVNLNCYVAYSI